MIIIVKTQAEWDALPASFAEFAVIEIRSDPAIWLRIAKSSNNSRAELRESSRAVLWGSSCAELWGSSSAVLRESSSAVLRESSSAVLRGSSRAILRGSSRAELSGSSSAVLRESSRAELRGSSSAELWGSSRAELWGSSRAVLRESSSAVLRESSRAVLWESSSAELWGSSSAELWESSRAELWGSSCAELRGSSSAVLRGRATAHQRSKSIPELHGQSVCFLYEKFGAPIKKSEHATIIQVRPPAVGAQCWLEEQGIELAPSVTLYKRVSKDFLTQEGTRNETTWVIGEIKIHPNWQPEEEECGPGKFHAVSRPYCGDQFREVDGDRYVAIGVKVVDLYAWPNPRYPTKIAFREGVVLYECDRWGDRVK